MVFRIGQVEPTELPAVLNAIIRSEPVRYWVYTVQLNLAVHIMAWELLEGGAG